MFNTEVGEAYVAPQSVSFTLEFTTPLTRTSLGPLPYDVFMLANVTALGNENHEIHLADVAPTLLMQAGLLGAEDDTSSALDNRYFKSVKNLPWGLHVPGDWKYPVETTKIVDAYLRFGAWAESGGRDYADWYRITAAISEEVLYNN